MKRLMAACAGSVALATGLSLAPAAAFAGTAAPAPTSHIEHGRISPGRDVNLRAVTRAAAKGHPAVASPARYFNAGAVAAQRAAAVRSGGRRSGLTALTASPNAIEAVGPAETWVDFPAMSLGEQRNLFGADQEVQPPDTQIAAGPGAVVEALNDSLSVWSKTGNLLDALDINSFLSVPSGQSFTDPRVLYDAQSGHWFLTGWSLDPTLTDTMAYLAVSATSDPTGEWKVLTIASSTMGDLTDQPMLGVCDDKVVVAWNEFTASGATSAGAVAWVFDKSALTGTASLPITGLASAQEFRFVPAQSLSSTTTCYMAVNNSDPASLGSNTNTPSLGVYAITGTNAVGNVAFNETQLPIPATSPPPAPRQPSGTTNDTVNDDRLLSAVWENDLLWTSATESCTPSGDTMTRDCMRLDKVNAPVSGTPTLALDTDATKIGADLYYPAVSMNGASDLFVAYTASSPSLPPGAYAVISPAAMSGAFSAPVDIGVGSTSYASVGNARWGDYSGAAPDPSVPGAVWVAGEYAPPDANMGDWGTAAAEVSLTAPPPYAEAVGVEGSNGQLYAEAPQLPVGWQSLGGQISAAPAVAAVPNRNGTTPAAPLFIARGSNPELWMRSLTAGWQPVGPSEAFCINGPAAVVTGTTLTVACRGTDNALWYNTAPWSGTGLPVFTSPWTSLGGILSAGPAVAPVGGVMTFFVRGTNGQIFTSTESPGYTATPWFCIGHPAAAKEASSSDTVFACQGGDGSLWEAANGGTGWTPAMSLGGLLIDGPGIAAMSRATEFLAEGRDGSVWGRDTVTGWQPLGGLVSGGIGAVALN